jgi:hypothetical protein
MVKKTYSLALLAAAVMIMPTAAFAGEAVTRKKLIKMLLLVVKIAE